MKKVPTATIILMALAFLLLVGMLSLTARRKPKTAMSNEEAGDWGTPPLEWVREEVRMAKDVEESDWKAAQDILVDLQNESAFGIIRELIDQQTPSHLPFEYVFTNRLKPSFSHERLRMTIRSEITLMAGNHANFERMTNFFARQAERLSRQNAKTSEFYYHYRRTLTEKHLPEDCPFVNVDGKWMTVDEAAVYSEIKDFNTVFISNEMDVCVFGKNAKPICDWQFTNAILKKIIF